VCSSDLVAVAVLLGQALLQVLVGLVGLVSVVFIHGDYDDKQIRNY
jgi:hypothetical protein